MQKFETACHCKKIRSAFDLPIITVVQCHCQNCRQLQGADYSSWVVVPEKQHSINSGRERLREYKFNQRSAKLFCDFCGTTVYGINGKHFPGQLVIPLGSVLDFDSQLNPQIQVYSQDKACWVELSQSVPIHE